MRVYASDAVRVYASRAIPSSPALPLSGLPHGCVPLVPRYDYDVAGLSGPGQWIPSRTRKLREVLADVFTEVAFLRGGA